MGLRPDQSQKLVALFLLGTLLLTYPLLALFNRADAAVAGVPLLYAYLFGAWGGLIALLAWVVHGRSDRGGAARP
jgi:TRAP-type C4-dicarboxylate transport system permease small subunit